MYMLSIAYLPRGGSGAIAAASRWLPFRQTIQCLVEIGERNTRAICVANDGRPIGCQTRDSECHCDPVIPMRLNLRTAQFSRAPSLDFQSIRTFFHLGTHAPQILRERRDAIALLDAQFRRIANLNSLFGVRPQC